MSKLEVKLKAQLTSLFGVTQILYEETDNHARGKRHIINLHEARALAKVQLKRAKQLLESNL